MGLFSKDKIGYTLAPFTGGLSLMGTKGGKNVMGTNKYDVSVDPYWREEAKGLASALREQGQGKGPASAAELSLASALRKNQAQSQGNIRSIGGINPALRQRMLAQTGAQTGADIAEKGGLLRAQETAEAQNRLGTLLANMESAAQAEQQLKQKSFQGAQDARREYFTSAMGTLGTKFGKN